MDERAERAERPEPTEPVRRPDQPEGSDNGTPGAAEPRAAAAEPVTGAEPPARSGLRPPDPAARQGHRPPPRAALPAHPRRAPHPPGQSGPAPRQAGTHRPAGPADAERAPAPPRSGGHPGPRSHPRSQPDSAPPQGPTPAQRLAAAFLRPGRGQITAALLLAVLGFALAVQVRSNSADTRLQVARQSDLVRILDDVTERSERLRAETRRLEQQREQLRSGADGGRQALAQAQLKARNLGILAGTERAYGSGIVLTVRDPKSQLKADSFLDTVQELRDAGAEAIQVNHVRVVAGTDFVTERLGLIMVGGQGVSAPYVFRAIGDPQTLASSLRIPGGVMETIRKNRGEPSVELREDLVIDATLPLPESQFARQTD